MKVSDWDIAHAADLSAFYAPVSVARADLVKGGITSAMRSILSEQQIGEVMAMTLLQGRD